MTERHHQRSLGRRQCALPLRTSPALLDTAGQCWAGVVRAMGPQPPLCGPVAPTPEHVNAGDAEAFSTLGRPCPHTWPISHTDTGRPAHWDGLARPGCVPCARCQEQFHSQGRLGWGSPQLDLCSVLSGAWQLRHPAVLSLGSLRLPHE